MPQNHWRIIDEPLNFNLVCQISNAYAVAKEWDAFLEANPDVADCFEMAPAIYVPIMNRIRDIDKQAEEILSAARQKALANEADIVAKAKEEAARIIARANAEAELEKKKAADDVKKEMIQIASAMAGKVVAANIDTTVSDGLIDETLKEIGESTWLS